MNQIEINKREDGEILEYEIQFAELITMSSMKNKVFLSSSQMKELKEKIAKLEI